MGICISHSTDQIRSATTISNLGEQLAHVLPASGWRQISHLFGGGFADVAEIPPRQAGQIADILRKAARHRLMPGDWADLAGIFADAAQRAARAGQSWTWSRPDASPTLRPWFSTGAVVLSRNGAH